MRRRGGHARLVVGKERAPCRDTWSSGPSPTGLNIPATLDGASICTGVVDGNAGLGVTWVHSYVSQDKTTTFCVYDGPSPEAIRQAAQVNDLPVDQITEVSVLDPYFHH